jgi:hypothetical protein
VRQAWTAKTASISIAAPPGSSATPTDVRACAPEDLEEQRGGAVDDRRLPVESRCRPDEAADADDALDSFDVAEHKRRFAEARESRLAGALDSLLD